MRVEIKKETTASKKKKGKAESSIVRGVMWWRQKTLRGEGIQAENRQSGWLQRMQGCITQGQRRV